MTPHALQLRGTADILHLTAKYIKVSTESCLIVSYASSWILLQLIIIPQPQPHYGFLALNKHRKMVLEDVDSGRS